MKLRRIAVLAVFTLMMACLMMASRVPLPDTGGRASVLEEFGIEQPDTEAPVIRGVRNITVDMLAAPAYRQGVSVSDNEEGAVLEINSAGVDTSVPGEYTVIYIARDAAGNETREQAKVIVTSVSAQELERMADAVLDEIIADGANDEDKALAIHSWVQSNIVYTSEGEKNGIHEGAYNGLALRSGDCYTYYALAKYLLERTGIESIDLTRVPEADTRHYWLLLDLGKGWHHYDACPILREQKKLRPRGGFMLTQGEAQAFAEAYGRPDYYSFPPECLPEGVKIAQGDKV